MQAGIRILNQAGIPTYLTPDQAVQAFMHLVDYGRNLDLLYQTPREIPLEFAVDRGKIRENFLPPILQGKDPRGARFQGPPCRIWNSRNHARARSQ